MEVKKAIEKRRSIRKYKARSVSKKKILEIIKAGALAPSGCNSQPWKFYPITNKKIIEKLKTNGAFHQDFVYESPAIIVCCGDPNEYLGKAGGEYQIKEGTIPKDKKTREGWFEFLQGKEETRAIRDLTIASSFMMLRATELGLGTCFIGLIKEEILKKVLKIPKNLVIPYVIILGYPAEEPKPRPRKKFEEICLKTYLD